MVKRNQRNRRHGTNELIAAEAVPRKKGRLSPTNSNAAESVEYSMIDLVRSVERLHFCKSGEKKDTVMWADVKKHYKKTTGRVLTTEVFNKLAGVVGISRKELIAGPLAGLLVAEDPAALVLRFKYDANKGDPLINHRFYLEASGSKTSVHHANGAEISPRVADVTNGGSSPARSETSSVSPTCLSSISTDPETDALSPISASSPIGSSAPLSPETREFVTANDDLAQGDQSFLTARTSPMSSDWETSSRSSRADTATPLSPGRLLNGSSDQERTLNPLDISGGEAEEGETSEILAKMEAAHSEKKGEEKEKKEEEEVREVKTSKGEEEKKEQFVEDGSDKENHVEPAVQPVQQLQTKAAATTPPREEEAVMGETEVPQAVKETVVESSLEGEGEEEMELETTKADEREEEVKKEQERKNYLAAGDAPPPSPHQSAADAGASPVTTSSSDEAILTVIERPIGQATVPLEEETEKVVAEAEDEKMEVDYEAEVRPPIEDVVEYTYTLAPVAAAKEETEEEEVEQKEEKELEEDAPPKMDEPAAEEEEKGVPEEAAVPEVTVVDEEEGKSSQVAVAMEELSLSAAAATHSIEKEEKEEEAPAKPTHRAAEIVETINEESDVTDEPTAPTVITVQPAAVAAVVPAVPAATTPVLTPPPPPAHEPMTSDDVDMRDFLAGAPVRDLHTPSVTAPITLQPKPSPTIAEPEDEDIEVITRQPALVAEETDAAAPPTAVYAAAASKDEEVAATPDLALRRPSPPKKFPCCTIV